MHFCLETAAAKYISVISKDLHRFTCKPNYRWRQRCRLIWLRQSFGVGSLYWQP